MSLKIYTDSDKEILGNLNISSSELNTLYIKNVGIIPQTLLRLTIETTTVEYGLSLSTTVGNNKTVVVNQEISPSNSLPIYIKSLPNQVIDNIKTIGLLSISMEYV